MAYCQASGYPTRVALGWIPPRFRSVAAVVSLLVVAVAVWRTAAFYAELPITRRIERGIAAAEAGKPLDAEKEWRAALVSDPNRVEAYSLLAELYLNGGHPELAVPLLERLRRLSPRSPHVLCRLADAYTRLDETKLGREAAQQAVLLEPNCARAHALLGIYLGDDQDSRGAIAELRKATALAPGDNRIAMSLAQAYLDASELDGAEQIARQVTRQEPSYATAWYTLARAYARRTPTPENLTQAIGAYEKAIRANPDLASAYAEIGRLKLLAGDPAGAIKPLRHLYDRRVRSRDLVYNLAAAYRRTGELALASRLSVEFDRISRLEDRLNATKKRLSLDPSNPSVALDLAELDIQAHDADSAGHLLEGVLKSRPTDRRALRLAAELYDKLGQRRTAAAFRSRLAALGRGS